MYKYFEHLLTPVAKCLENILKFFVPNNNDNIVQQ
jgi:hypothetical protein